MTTRARSAIAHTFFTAAVLIALVMMGARLDGAAASDINQMIGGGSDDATTRALDGTDGATDGTPQADAAIDQGLDGGYRAPTDFPRGDDAAAAAPKELWVAKASSMEHIDVIEARPLGQDTCRQVIFDAHPPLKRRLAVKPGEQLSIGLNALCMLSLRNSSDNRVMVVRLGDAFETISIVPHPQLFTGLVIAPGQQITIPIRPVQESIDVKLETVWKQDINADNPSINSATLRFKP